MSKNARKSPAKPKRPKTKLGLPDLDHSKSAVLDSLRSPESKRGYQHAVEIQRPPASSREVDAGGLYLHQDFTP